MSVAAPPEAPAGPPPGPAGGTLRERAGARWRALRWLVAVAAVVVLAALAGALLVPRTGAGQLDPDSAEPGGGRAVARILGDRGVDVRQETSSAAAAALGGPDATLLVVDVNVLGPAQLRALAEAGWGSIVLVQPDAIVLGELAPGVRAAGLVPGDVAAPGCAAAAPRAAGEVLAGGRMYELRGGASGEVCYRVDGDRPQSGSWVEVDSAGVGRVTVTGQGRLLTNERLADDGNAALALTTLGGHDRLVWLMADPLEAGGTGAQRSLSDLLPRWVPWTAAQLAVAVLLMLLWRGRRLGGLVPEPLPVVVRAAETEEGRARLYRRSGARGRAAATLRTAALRRLAARLAGPPGTEPEQVATLVAAATGRSEAAVQAVLLGPAPARDADLVELADELDALERDVARDATGRNPQP